MAIWRAMVGRLRISFVLATLVAAIGCSAHRSEKKLPLPPAPHTGANPSFVVAPARAEELLEKETLTVVSAKQTESGVTGASKLTLRVGPENQELAVKWKPVPRTLDGWNNSPRKELAAYVVQKLFLEPDDYVVPTTVIRCIELEEYSKAFPNARANMPNAKCVLGAMSLWLKDVHPGKLDVDHERFSRDANYAGHFADFNLLTYLIAHKDGRSSNFLLGGDESDERVFSVDNGISFDPWIYNYFVPNWDGLKVPALRREAIDRLRKVSKDTLESMGVLVELRLDENGIYRSVPPGKNLDDDDGARHDKGVVQFGLSEDEIEELEDRIDDLIEEVDDGEVALF